MRYSSVQRLAYEKWTGTNRELFAHIAQTVALEHRTPAVVLVGARDHASLTVRRAQAALRFDHRPSYWSHAVLVTDWRDAPLGVEVDLHGPDRLLLPERNGARQVSLSRYSDDRRWPNLAVATIGGWTPPEGLPKTQQVLAANWRQRVCDAALQPNAQRARYRLFEWIAGWKAHIFRPHEVANPVVAGLAHPGAALVEYAFSVAPLDIAPGGTSPAVCPEHLWATLLHWHDRLETQAGTVSVVARVTDASGRSIDRNSQLPRRAVTF